MPKISNGDFNQKEYNAKWRAENMMRVSATYKNEFVLAFREACQKLGISQAEVIRNAMQSTISKAENKQKLTDTK
nr:hypothetical protein [uncultured Oribacterium sp.]